MQVITWVLLGLSAGVLSGLFGIGGGLIIVPALVFIFGLTQQEAQGTSLAVLLPPVGLLAVYKYYQAGHVRFSMAMFIALGLLVGAFFGAKIAQNLDALTMRRTFAVFLAGVSAYMYFK